MLAQNGANINSKTRNGETPYDICADPDIKERQSDPKQTKNTRGLKCNFSEDILWDKLTLVNQTLDKHFDKYLMDFKAYPRTRKDFNCHY